MRLGSYTTIDCPTEKQVEAFAWLQTEFDKIGGYVRRVSNSHDFGPYPSFEIDYPEKFEDFDDMALEDGEYENEEDKTLSNEKDEWDDKANEIQDAYNKKFSEYL